MKLFFLLLPLTLITLFTAPIITGATGASRASSSSEEEESEATLFDNMRLAMEIFALNRAESTRKFIQDNGLDMNVWETHKQERFSILLSGERNHTATHTKNRHRHHHTEHHTKIDVGSASFSIRETRGSLYVHVHNINAYVKTDEYLAKCLKDLCEKCQSFNITYICFDKKILSKDLFMPSQVSKSIMDLMYSKVTYLPKFWRFSMPYWAIDEALQCMTEYIKFLESRPCFHP